jgi:hypothetical protein
MVQFEKLNPFQQDNDPKHTHGKEDFNADGALESSTRGLAFSKPISKHINPIENLWSSSSSSSSSSTSTTTTTTTSSQLGIVAKDRTRSNEDQLFD